VPPGLIFGDMQCCIYMEASVSISGLAGGPMSA
jgi:hypothetical protein